MKHSLTLRTLRGFIWVIAGSGVQAILKIAVLAVLARLITPAEFGVVGIALIVVEFSKLFTHMGVGPALVQRKELTDNHLKTGFTLSLLMGAFFSSLLLATAPYIASFFEMPGLVAALRVVSIIFMIDSITLIGQALMQRNLQFKKIASVEISSYALGYGVVGIVLAFMGWGLWALIAAHITQAVLLAILILYIQPFPKKLQLNKTAFRELIYFGGGMTFGRIGNYLANQGDNLMIGKLLGPAALGIYGRAYQFMVMPANLFGSALDKALFPAMAKVQDDKAKLSQAYLTGVSSIALVSIPLSVIMFFLAPELIYVVLGPEWTEVIIPFKILACSLLFRTSYKMSDSLARATGAVYKRAWRQVIYASLIFLAAYIGHKRGLDGVSAGVVLALFTNFILMAQLSKSVAGFTWTSFLKAHQHGFTLGVMTAILCYAFVSLNRYLFDSELLILVLSSIFVLLLILFSIRIQPFLFVGDEHRKLLQLPLFKRFKILHPQSS